MYDSIAAAHAALVAGGTTARALVESSLSAIDRRGAETNAFVTVLADRARAAAARSDAERAAGIDCGPLHGIPISLKDIIDVAGVVTTAGSHVLDDRVPKTDASVVSRLEEAGAIVIGKANLHQFALGTTSDDSAYGPVKNPHDTSRVAGGSSGGSAVAVATGMGLASVGTDTGASIRVPAALCGVVGLKATFGEIPTTGVIPLSTSLDHVGPIARTVQDAAWMWQVMSGRPTTLVTPASLGALRIGQLGGYFDELLQPEVRAALGVALQRLGDAGARARPVEVIGTDRISQIYADIVLAEAASWHAQFLDTRRTGYSPTVHERIATLGRAVKAADYLDARRECLRLRNTVDQLFDTVDVLVLPTLPIVAPIIGMTEINVDPAEPQTRPVRTVMLRLTQLFNLTGHPAISLPIASSGLPVGLQLVGRRDQTAALVAVAAACESTWGAAATAS
jgi:aspartyl-tRNA(Asn)/glutamyl-tRNA(Gln) amidotransferase subunit A